MPERLFLYETLTQKMGQALRNLSGSTKIDADTATRYMDRYIMQTGCTFILTYMKVRVNKDNILTKDEQNFLRHITLIPVKKLNNLL